MKARYQVNRVTFELEIESPKDMFKLLASIQNTFGADTECGLCHSPQLRFQVRNPKGYDYYELACESCNATLSLGVLQDNSGLFPKRLTQDYDPLPNRGWKIWQGTTAATKGNAAKGDKQEEVPF